MDRVFVKTPEEAGAMLEVALQGLPARAQLTVADAAARSGLSLDDAERGLHQLSTQFRGTLSATDQGELLFRFPYGLSLPLTKKPWFLRAVDRVKRVVVGVGKFVVRAWVSIVMVGYAVVFVALALALMFGGKSDSDRGAGNALGVVLRVLFEALYWTFHPFSPMARRNVWDGSVYDERRIHRGRGQRSRTVRRFGQLVTIQEDDDVAAEEIPFYEKVNRFVFGPEAEPPMPIEVHKKRLVAQIRARQGRIGLLDVMRVTGLPREEADPLIARLLLDFEGEVDVDDNGAITYRFEKLRKTAGDTAATAPPPSWDRKKVAPPVTGNAVGANFLVGAVNAFNVVMATVALSLNMTVERLVHLFQHWNSVIPVEPLPYGGIPVVLGLVPLVFSLVLFALPALRMLRHGQKERAVADDNARAEVLKTVFQTMTDAAARGEAVAGVREDRLKQAWQQATGKAPDDKELIAAVVALGGDVDMDAMAEGRGLYRFRDLEAEVKALQAERATASVAEEAVGEVVYRAE